MKNFTKLIFSLEVILISIVWTVLKSYKYKVFDHSKFKIRHSKLILLFLFLSFQSFGQYCEPTTNCTEGDGMSIFGIGSFSNASGCEADNGVAGYGDFTALTGFDLPQGAPATVTLLSGFDLQQISIWIDIDNSMSFDSSELILADEPVETEIVTAEIVVPNIPLGSYRLRVQANYDAPSSVDACLVGDFGETEDYTVNIVTPPSCIAVNSVSASTVGASTATISWMENGTSTNWDVEFVELGNSPTGIPSAGFDDVSNPAMLTGLSPLTTYEVFVRSDCGMDNTDVSFWSAPTIFTTLCGSFVPTYVQDFSILTVDGIPDCWSQGEDGDFTTGPATLGTSIWFEDGFANDGTVGAMKINLYQGEVANDWLISPIMDLTSGGPFQAEFDFSITAFSTQNSGTLGSDDQVAFLVSTDLGTSWTALQTWTAADNVNPLGEKIIHDLTPFDGMNVIFAFWGSDGVIDDVEDNDITIDNFIVRVPPTCLEISSLDVSSITGSSVVLSWVENGSATTWDVEFDEIGFTPTGTPTTGFDDISNPVTLTGLLPITTYDAYIRPDCGMDNTTDVGIWIGPITFTTECNAFVPTFMEDFNSLVFGAVPDCWSEGTDGDFSTGPANLGFSSWNEDGFANDGLDGAFKINLYQGNVANEWLLTPTMDLTTGGPYQVEFDFSITDFANQTSGVLGSDDQVAFLISTDLGNTWTALQTWTAADNVNPLGEKIIHDLTPFDGMNVVFAFWGTDGITDDAEDNDIFVDNFFVRVPPTCPEISELTVGNVTATTADISWVENGSATTWDIEFVETGLTPTGTSSVGFDDISNPTTLTGLSPVTTYDVYVRSDCGMDNTTDVGIWIGPITFTTECAVFPAPYFTDFTNLLNGDCWVEADNGLIADGPLDIGAGSWIDDGYANDGFTGAAKINLFSTGKMDWLISPDIDLTGGFHQVEFDFLIATFNDSIVGQLGSDDRVAFLVSSDNMVTWTVLKLWDTNSTIAPGGDHEIIDVSNLSGMTVNFAFWGSEGTVDDTEDNDVFVDNFAVNFIPAAPLAFTSNITSISCNGLSDGAIDLTTTGGVAPLMFDWSNGEMTEDIANLPSGNYTVTITDSDGSSIEATLSVSQPPALTASTTVTDESLDGAADGTIDLTVNGGIAGYTFLWDNQATTEDLSGLADGTYCVTITDTNDCTQEICETVNAGPVSIKNIEDLTSFKVYPNPVGNESIWIELEFSEIKDLEIRIVNTLGQEVFQSRNFQILDLKKEVDASKFSSGIYFVKITSLNENQILNYRFVKQ